jgi:hypothetical protein
MGKITAMPTPFQHLVYARSMLREPLLPESIRHLLEQEAGAFYLGNTAVDVQAITQQPRYETHFYHLADIGVTPAIPVMLATYPTLADPYQLSGAQAAFISGYLVHLAWDEMWAGRIFIPVYMESGLWTERLARVMHHNALRVLLDRQAVMKLCMYPELQSLLRNVIPGQWLPFVTDDALHQWRDWLISQLAHPDKVETAQVFAARMNITLDELQQVIHAIEQQTYQPTVQGLTAAIQDYEQCARLASVNALLEYWQLDAEEAMFEDFHLVCERPVTYSELVSVSY